MSKSAHTRGPWRRNEHPYDNQPEYILAPADSRDPDQEICTVSRHRNFYLDPKSKEEAVANAERIVACVNACEGITDASVVPEMMDFIKWFVEQCEDDAPAEGHPGYASAVSLIAKAGAGKRGNNYE